MNNYKAPLNDMRFLLQAMAGDVAADLDVVIVQAAKFVEGA